VCFLFLVSFHPRIYPHVLLHDTENKITQFMTACSCSTFAELMMWVDEYIRGTMERHHIEEGRKVDTCTDNCFPTDSLPTSGRDFFASSFRNTLHEFLEVVR
jgi:hypothetical protein